MATQVIMPQMGESIAEGTITKWIKKVGDAVERDEPHLRDLDRQGGRGDPVAGRRHADRDQGPGGRDGRRSTRSSASSARRPRSPPRLPLRRRPRRSPAAPTAPGARDPVGTARRSAARRPRLPPARPAVRRAARRSAAARAGPRSDADRRPGRVDRGAHPPALVAARAQDRAGAHDRHRRGRRHRHPQPRDEERHPLLHREPQGRFRAGAPPPRPRSAGAHGRTRPSRAGARARAPRSPSTERDEVVAMTKIRKITAENMILSKRTSAHVHTVFQVDYTTSRRSGEAQGRRSSRRTASS